MQKLRSLVNAGDYEEAAEDDISLTDDFCAQCGLSTEQRLYGFAACLAGGLVCVSLSLFLLFRPIKFAVAFTFGNLLSLGSTTFLIGPLKQMKMMFDSARIAASSIFLGSLVLALVFALYMHSTILTLIAVVIEFCALLWYSLSYVPFARGAAKKLMSGYLKQNSETFPYRLIL